jgi:hypothetical protein
MLQRHDYIGFSGFLRPDDPASGVKDRVKGVINRSYETKDDY